MGGQVSVHDEDGQNIGQNAEPIDGGVDEPLTGLDTRNHWLTKAMRARIVYVTIFGCFIGLGIPLILYWANKPSGPGPIYGSCLIKTEFRFKCLINQFSDPTEEQCIDAMCCWEKNDTLPFKCYHSLNPAYQYHVIGDAGAQAQKALGSRVPGQAAEFSIEPNHKERMTKLQVKLLWEDAEQLNIQIFDPDKFPQGIPTQSSVGIKSQIINGDVSIEGLDVTFSDKSGDYFYIRIGRNETGETIFDTRIGPLISSGNDISFATILPTQYFHGLRGGQENGPIIYDVVNGRNSMDLPFYMPLEKSGKVSGILFETPAPFIVQFVEAPALMFHFEGARVGLNMRFFMGPTVKHVTRQLTTYLSKGEPNYKIPPYWALGLHLCQQLSTGEDALQQIVALERIPPLAKIPYDSHCGEINLRNPFRVNEGKYNKTVVDNIVSHLLGNQKRLLLAQRIGLEENDYSDISNSAPFINWPNKTGLLGLNEGKKIFYPNTYHEDFMDWLELEFKEFEDTNATIFANSSGLVLIDNIPIQENSIKSCSNVKNSRLHKKFLGEKDGLVCPNAMHFLTDTKAESKVHFDIHNEYGHETVGKFAEAYQNLVDKENIIITSSSIRPNTFLQSGFNGLSVPFTWNGMVDSLSHILRNFMMLRFAGTPICGSYVPSGSPRNDDELCLRWFQLGLLLPFARNTYGKNIARGPLDFNMNDQKNLIDAIQERYRYNPYYYTLFHLFNETREPVIRPLAYDFHEEPPVSFNILTQFMIGPALMAAPILSKATTTRDAYFPPGVWFEASGKLVYDNLAQGSTQTIPGLASTTPLFLRGGHVIPTLTTPIATTGEKSRSGDYTILATYPQHGTDVPSKGILFVDDGENNMNSHKVEFTVTNKSITITSNCNSKDPTSSISTIINQIKIFGFPSPQPEVETNIPGQIRPDITYSEEDMVLRMKTCGVDWCNQTSIEFTWDLNRAVEE